MISTATDMVSTGYVAPAERQTAKRRVLVVDDTVNVGNMIALALRYGGYEARAVKSVDEALDRIDFEQPSLVITDLRMSPVSGWDLMTLCRRHYPALPFLIASGEPQGTHPEIEQHALGFLGKPFAVHQLLEVVDRIFLQLRAGAA